MKIQIIAIGKNMPTWVKTGYQEYAKRLSTDWSLELIEISMPKRTSTTTPAHCMEGEAKKILTAIPKNSYVIALDEHGRLQTTTEMAGTLNKLQQHTQQLSFLIGGPDGLAPSCKERANELWSLSPLTLPHPLVRPLLAEQLYRAHSLLSHHPYHRA